LKKYLSLILVLMLATAVLAGCGKTAQEQDPMVFYTVYSGEVQTLNYLITATTNDMIMTANMVDPLIEYDNLGNIQPALAESWRVSSDGLKWTFNLRQGVKWYTHAGEEHAEVVAQDWVDAMKYILTPENASKTANILFGVIKNADEYYNGDITDFSQVGVKAINEYTLQYTLAEPVPYFLSMVNYVNFFPANGQFLAEKGDRFGTDNTNILYNGAYIMETFEHQNRRILVKNENYWDADNVFITELNYQYNAEAGALGPELFRRGEITGVAIPASIIDEWMNDPEKKEMVRPGLPSDYTFWWAFNFDPKYDQAFGPENWKVAVNNLNFRKSLFHGLDRVAAMLTAEPFFPEARLHNTITPANFVQLKGEDYTGMGNLASIVNTNPFDANKAKDFKAKAKAELDGLVTFPVQVVMPYNTGFEAWTNRVQVVKQQLENLLGADFIQIVPLPHAPTGFLNGTRRAGNYSFMEVNWGPDYADPQTYTDPFGASSTYAFPINTTEVDADGNNIFEVYQGLIAAAKAETKNLERRYELFANAEAYIIDMAWVLPYHRGGGGYVASHLNPFESPYAPFGLSQYSYKGMKIMDKPMSAEEYQAARAEWDSKR